MARRQTWAAGAHALAGLAAHLAQQAAEAARQAAEAKAEAVEVEAREAAQGAAEAGVAEETMAEGTAHAGEATGVAAEGGVAEETMAEGTAHAVEAREAAQGAAEAGVAEETMAEGTAHAGDATGRAAEGAGEASGADAEAGAELEVHAASPVPAGNAPQGQQGKVLAGPFSTSSTSCGSSSESRDASGAATPPWEGRSEDDWSVDTNDGPDLSSGGFGWSPGGLHRARHARFEEGGQRRQERRDAERKEAAFQRLPRDVGDAAYTEERCPLYGDWFRWGW